jgi:hypothetical protein
VSGRKNVENPALPFYMAQSVPLQAHKATITDALNDHPQEEKR